MNRVVSTARLEGGPHDGCHDGVVLPAPELVTWQWCAACRRDHLHAVKDSTDNPELSGLRELITVPRALYLLDHEASTPIEQVYRYLDVDDDLDQLLHIEQLAAIA